MMMDASLCLFVFSSILHRNQNRDARKSLLETGAISWDARKPMLEAGAISWDVFF